MSDPSAELDRARALLELGRGEHALELIHRALAAQPDSASGHQLAAEALLQLDRADEALHAAERSIAIDGSPSTLHTAARAARVAGEHDLAIAHIGEALRLAPDEALLHVGLAVTLLARHELTESNEDLDDAEAAASAAVQIDPTLPVAHYARALQAVRRGNLPEAGNHIEATLQHAPEWVDAHLLAGEIRQRQGMPRLASRHFAMAGASGVDGRALDRLRDLGRRIRRWRRDPGKNPYLDVQARRILQADRDLGGRF